jgi:hypothetical protein
MDGRKGLQSIKVEETKNLKIPVIEAINQILNPFDRIERQLSEVQRLLNLRGEDMNQYNIQGPVREKVITQRQKLKMTVKKLLSYPVQHV